MREVFLGVASAAAILAVCMGAGDADMRVGAFILAILSGVCVTISAILQPNKPTN